MSFTPSDEELELPEPPPTLELWKRAHDLPPRWDGMVVEWSGWKSTDDMFICPRPRSRSGQDCCHFCGSKKPPTINLGRVWTDPTNSPPEISRGRLDKGRHLVANISAFRCPDCRRDHVLDSGGNAWDLDETDYTDEGSWEV